MDPAPLSTLLSHALLTFTIELDNEFEHRLEESGERARVVSVVMWSNLLRFVEDGMTVGELQEAASLPRARTLSTLGGMERWGYIRVGPETGTKRDGFGSARGLRGEWLVRPSGAGRAAAKIWPALFGEVDRRWAERFGRESIDALRESLAAIVDRLDVELPEYVPIVDGRDGMRVGLAPLEPRGASMPDSRLAVLLSRALLAYTIDFERESELSLPLSENVLRVLDEDGIAVRDLPLAAGVPKEATSMALTFLTRNDYAAVEAKTGRLTPAGRRARDSLPRLHADVEELWKARFGAARVGQLRTALERVLGHPLLARGLAPNAEGWRATKRYAAHTAAMLAEPRSALPRYPMVLHRGGWPDGS